MTISELVDFVIRYRRGKAFEGWSPIEIAETFIDAANDRLLLYSVENGVVVGVVHGKRFSNVVYVCNILTTRSGVLTNFVRRFRELYPTSRLEARRHDRVVQYNTDRFVQKVLQHNH